MANIFFEQQLYTLEDLQDYALQQFPNEYAALATCPTWVIEHRTIRNGAKKLERVPMLLVGRPFYHHGNQTAWAYTTGTNIEYYYAGRDEEFVTTVPDLFNNKIYYNDPLTYIAGSQDTYGMSKSRRTGKALAELVINFMFLFMGHNATMQNPGHTDLLPDFEYACKTFAPNRQARMDKQRRELVAYHRNDAEQAWERQHGPQMASSSSLDSSSTSSYIKSELGDDGTALALDSIPLYDSATSSVSGSTSHIRSHLMSSPVALANRSHSALSSDPFRFRLPLSGSSRSSSSASHSQSSSSSSRTPSSQQSSTSRARTASTRHGHRERRMPSALSTEERCRRLQAELEREKRRRREEKRAHRDTEQALGRLQRFFERPAGSEPYF